MFSRSILSLVLIFCVQWCFAQPVVTEIKDFRQRKVRADSVMNVLKSGVLIIRLSSDAKKIQALKDRYTSISDPDTRQKVQKRIDKTIKERDDFNQALIAALDDYYTYSDYLIMYDTANRSLTKGIQSGIFLNKDLELDPSINLDNKNYVILRNGVSDYVTTNRLRGLIFADATLVDLQNPFPYFQPIDSNFKSFMAAIFPGLTSNINADKIVIKINRKLTQY